MKKEKDNQLYDKIEDLCQRIESYKTKVISIKNEAKNAIYADKLVKLINMIKYEEKMQNYDIKKPKYPEIENEEIEEEAKTDDKYNPYSDNFYDKDRLQKCNGDVNALIEELKNEDKIGHRNAYIINEIKKYTNPEEVKEEATPETLISVENKNVSANVLNKMKKIIRKIKELFTWGNSTKN